MLPAVGARSQYILQATPPLAVERLVRYRGDVEPVLSAGSTSLDSTASAVAM
jgi:hypothetical protein